MLCAEKTVCWQTLFKIKATFSDLNADFCKNNTNIYNLLEMICLYIGLYKAFWHICRRSPTFSSLTCNFHCLQPFFVNKIPAVMAKTHFLKLLDNCLQFQLLHWIHHGNQFHLQEFTIQRIIPTGPTTLLYRWRNWKPKMWSGLHRVIQLIMAKLGGGCRSPGSLAPGSCH